MQPATPLPTHPIAPGRGSGAKLGYMCINLSASLPPPKKDTFLKKKKRARAARGGRLSRIRQDQQFSHQVKKFEDYLAAYIYICNINTPREAPPPHALPAKRAFSNSNPKATREEKTHDRTENIPKHERRSEREVFSSSRPHHHTPTQPPSFHSPHVNPTDALPSPANRSWTDRPTRGFDPGTRTAALVAKVW
jgi:hypothetical protein